MKKELEKQLVNRYPNLFRDYGGDARKTCMAWGMTHGDGWYKLLEEACEKIKDTDVVFNQIKEKFGMLNIYYSASHSDLVSNAIDEAEIKSLETCEVCGEKAKRVSDGGWLRTLCKKCRVMSEIEKEK